MEYVYRADAWQALYTAVAGATAALTGLLFIALSLNLHTIIKVPTHRARARETLGATLSLLVLSLLMLIPEQDRRILGSELIAGSLVLVLRAVKFHRQTLRRMVAERRVSLGLAPRGVACWHRTDVGSRHQPDRRAIWRTLLACTHDPDLYALVTQQRLAVSGASL